MLGRSGPGRRFLETYGRAQWHRSVRRQVRQELRDLADCQQENPQTMLRVVYDMENASPGLGEFTQVVLLARFLALQGNNVEFVLRDSVRRRSDWTDVLNAQEHEELLRELDGIAEYLLPHSVRLVRVAPETDTAALASERLTHTVFTEQVTAGEPIYVLTPFLLQSLASARQPPFPPGFLLGPDEFPTPPIHLAFKGHYIAWHVRYGKWSAERDSSVESIESDFLELRSAFPAHSIIIFSTPEGTAHALRILTMADLIATATESGVWVGAQPEKGFLATIPWLLGADFYFQRMGGGIGIIPIFSKVPYLILNDGDRGIHFSHGYAGNKIVPWATRRQRFEVHPGTAAWASIQGGLRGEAGKS